MPFDTDLTPAWLLDMAFKKTKVPKTPGSRPDRRVQPSHYLHPHQPRTYATETTGGTSQRPSVTLTTMQTRIFHTKTIIDVRLLDGWGVDRGGRGLGCGYGSSCKYNGWTGGSVGGLSERHGGTLKIVWVFREDGEERLMG